MVQYSPRLDDSFGALADPTRRGILQLLAATDASISELADRFEMTLTGMKKHIHVLEAAGLVESEKVGRVRRCRIGPRRMDQEMAWLENYRQMLEERYNRLEAFLEQKKGKA